MDNQRKLANKSLVVTFRALCEGSVFVRIQEKVVFSSVRYFAVGLSHRSPFLIESRTLYDLINNLSPSEGVVNLMAA